MDRPTLTAGYSSCPNDVFIFEALVSGRAGAGGLAFRAVIEDVEALNRRALKRELDVTKVSFHAFGHLRASHYLLDSGAALGRGCGPLLIASEPLDRGDLSRRRIAIPGELTTAALLLRLWAPEARDLEPMVFDRIIPAVEAGEAGAGVIIHESRFTYAGRGLRAVVDLGEWWERETGLPIPLGGIAADRRLGAEAARRIGARLRRSIEHARANPKEIWDAIRRRAQELDDEVIRAHIDLYVTDFTDSLGAEGRRAVEALLGRAEEAGIIPRESATDYFV